MKPASTRISAQCAGLLRLLDRCLDLILIYVFPQLHSLFPLLPLLYPLPLPQTLRNLTINPLPKGKRHTGSAGVAVQHSILPICIIATRQAVPLCPPYTGFVTTPSAWHRQSLLHLQARMAASRRR
jgi:hypothetical protein